MTSWDSKRTSFKDAVLLHEPTAKAGTLGTGHQKVPFRSRCPLPKNCEVPCHFAALQCAVQRSLHTPLQCQIAVITFIVIDGWHSNK